MKDLSFTITPEMLSEQNGIPLETARKIVSDLKYCGQFTAMSDGISITVFTPDTESAEFALEIEMMREYEITAERAMRGE